MEGNVRSLECNHLFKETHRCKEQAFRCNEEKKRPFRGPEKNQSRHTLAKNPDQGGETEALATGSL